MRMVNFWERMLMPAFVYFFKMVYPFRLSNSGFSGVAAVAGGCILLETRLIEETGGFKAIRNELIDDCSLAKRVKLSGLRPGLPCNVISSSIVPLDPASKAGLAGHVPAKSRGCRTWIGLTHSVQSLRSYENLSGIWNMVARSAFCQLRYSAALLAGTTVLMLTVFWLPVAGFFFPGVSVKLISAVGLAAMIFSYLPTLKFYKQSRRSSLRSISP
jgi:cellulose synthase/poly-beta-1,6-N-acetylglucosamine synthase-like glycosyltransferase